MRTPRQSPEHQEAVARRLALLTADLASSRPAPPYDDLRGLDDDEPPDPAVAPLVPTPGRHASRRAGRALAGAVPDTLRGRMALGPAQVAVVCVLVALGLALTCWWVVRGDAAVLPAPTLTSAAGLVPSAAGSPQPVAATGSPPEAGGTVTVDVTGKVRHPGIAVLDAGSRVVDALEAAGGARSGVDLSALNLARVLVDGEQVVVGVPAPAGVAAAASPSAGVPGGPLVNLNTASQAELEELPDVGPVTAQAIIAWRTDHGGYTAVDELLEVDGIGDATLSRLAPYVTL